MDETPRGVLTNKNNMDNTQLTTNLIKAAMQLELSVTDFAKAVASVLADEYGEHNYNEFITTLKEQLNTNK